MAQELEVTRWAAENRGELPKHLVENTVFCLQEELQECWGIVVNDSDLHRRFLEFIYRNFESTGDSSFLWLVGKLPSVISLVFLVELFGGIERDFSENQATQFFIALENCVAGLEPEEREAELLGSVRTIVESGIAKFGKDCQRACRRIRFELGDDVEWEG